MTLDTRQLATKEDLLQVKQELLQVKEDLLQLKEDLRTGLLQVKDDVRAELRHYATKGDLWRAIAFQTIALTGIVAAITKL